MLSIDTLVPDLNLTRLKNSNNNNYNNPKYA